jgi:hypothetical protein
MEARTSAEEELNLILETKGFDPLEQTKVQAAKRRVDAVSADDGTLGRWAFEIVKKPEDVRAVLDRA